MVHTTDGVSKLYFISEQNMGDFTLYFLGYERDDVKKLSTEEKCKTRFDREGTLLIAIARIPIC